MTTVEENDISKTFEVGTTVKFAAAREAFERVYTSTTLAGEVLAHALHAFEITTDGTTRCRTVSNAAVASGPAQRTMASGGFVFRASARNAKSELAGLKN